MNAAPRAVLQFCLFAALALLPTRGFAGVRLEFVTTVAAYSYSGTILIDKKVSRVDIREGIHPLFNPNISIITRERGEQIIVLDHAQRTYFVRYTDSMGGHLATARGMGRTTAKKPRVTRERSAGDEIAGVKTQRHIIRASYGLEMEVLSEKMRGTVEIEAVVDVAPHLEQDALPWGLHFASKTGFADVDRPIARQFPSDIPLRQVVTARRRIADGPEVIETIATTVTSLREEAIPAGEFSIPAGYRYEEPVLSFGQ